MAYSPAGLFTKLPNVPSFEPNDLNRGGGSGGCPCGRAGTSPTSVSNLEVTEREPSLFSVTDTDMEPPTHIWMSGKGTGVSFSPNVDHIFESSKLSEDFQGDLPGYVLYTKNKTSNLQMFRTYAELSEYLVNATSEGTQKDPENDIVVSDILNVPLKHVAQQATMGEYLRYLFANDRLMDVKIEVAGETFRAHRIVLGCYSNYLAELFYKSKRNRLPFELKINGICAAAFSAFLEFMYTGELHIFPTIAADLLLIADYLRVRTLQKRRGIINDFLPLDQIVKFVAMPGGSIPDRTLDRFVQHVLAHFLEVTRTKYFFEIDIEMLCRILGSDDLIVKTECDVYKAGVDWIFYDLKHRKKYADRVLSLVRYYYMTQDQFFTCIEMNSLARDMEGNHPLFRTANWSLTARSLGRPDPLDFPVPPPRKCYKFNTPTPRRSPVPPNFNSHAQSFSSQVSSVPSMPSPLMTSTPMTSPPKHSKVEGPKVEGPKVEGPKVEGPKVEGPKVEGKRVGKPVMLPSPMQRMTSPIPKTVDILVIGGFQTENESLPGQDHSSTEGFAHYCRLPEPMQHHAVTLLSGKLYLVGGSVPTNDEDTPVPIRRVSVMTVVGKQWSRVADMIDARANHCACAVGGKVYAIGGVGIHSRILNSVECYNPSTDMWSYVQFLTVPRFAAAATTLDGKIYVAGGIGENSGGVFQVPILSSVEVYDPETDRWTTKTPLRFPRCNSALVRVGERLYLCGGATRSANDHSALLVSVASLDEYIHERDVWCNATAMATPRHDAGVAVAGPRIYIIGGVSTTTESVLQSVECFDTRACEWLSGLKNLPVPSRNIRCVSVVSEWQHMNPNDGSESQ